MGIKEKWWPMLRNDFSIDDFLIVVNLNNIQKSKWHDRCTCDYAYLFELDNYGLRTLATTRDPSLAVDAGRL